MTKRVICFLLAVLMAVPMFACSKDTSELEETIIGLQAKLDYVEQQLAEERTKAPETVTETVVEKEEVEVLVPADMVVGVDCTLNGEASVMAAEAVKVHAVAVIPEGYAFDHWEVMGEEVEATGTEADFEVSGTGTVRAVLHKEHVLNCVNCTFQFLKSESKAGGDKLTTFNFENDYTNPVSGESCGGGKISGYVAAEIPKGYLVDYWLINGVKYEPNTDVKNFFVTELDEATTYEVVLVKETAKYYKVSCTNCTFSGGGYSNATSGKVKYGTKITVKAGSTGGYWTGSYSKGSWSNPILSADSFGYTVKKDCSFTWNFVIN